MSSYAITPSARRTNSEAAAANPATPREKNAIASDLEDLSPAQGWSTIKLLTTLCAMLGLAIVAAFLVIGLLVVRNGDQHTRLDNLGTKTVQQQDEINRLEVRVAQLEGSKR